MALVLALVGCGQSGGDFPAEPSCDLDEVMPLIEDCPTELGYAWFARWTRPSTNGGGDPAEYHPPEVELAAPWVRQDRLSCMLYEGHVGGTGLDAFRIVDGWSGWSREAPRLHYAYTLVTSPTELERRNVGCNAESHVARLAVKYCVEGQVVAYEGYRWESGKGERLQAPSDLARLRCGPPP